MQPIITDSSVVCRSVSLSVTIVSPAETAKLIGMPFGLWTQVDPKHHVLDWGQGPPFKEETLTGKGATNCKV